MFDKPNLESVRRYRTTPNLIADALREAIQCGELDSGQPLPQEEFAARFKVSRLPVREALRQLEAEGLVVVYPNRGAYVAELSPEEVREVYDLRVLIEGDALCRAVPLLTETDLRRAEAAHQALESETNRVKQGQLNREFHAALYVPLERPRQRTLIETLRGIVERYQYIQNSLLSHTTEFQNEHQQILRACQRRDAYGAQVALEEHFAHAAELAVAYLERRQRQADE